jgi:hypothetical protein
MGLFDFEPGEPEEYERRAAKERALEQRIAENAARLQAKYDSIESLLVPLLRDELEVEKQFTRVTAKMRADFSAFRKWCEEAGYPSLPAAPQAVAEYLAVSSVGARAM